MLHLLKTMFSDAENYGITFDIIIRVSFFLCNCELIFRHLIV